MSISVSLGVTTQTAETGTSAVSDRSTRARVQQNVSIMQASLEVSINTQNEPQTLLFRTAIDRLNEMLEPDYGANAIQAAASQDNSAEATAGRIVGLSTAFFESYKAQHSGEDDATVLKNFMQTIRSGFERGYNDAVNILKGLQVFDGDLATDIEKTHQLVLQGYADFESAQSAKIAGVGTSVSAA